MALYNLSLLVLSAHDTDCLKIPHAFTHRLENAVLSAQFVGV